MNNLKDLIVNRIDCEATREIFANRVIVNRAKHFNQPEMVVKNICKSEIMLRTEREYCNECDSIGSLIGIGNVKKCSIKDKDTTMLIH